MKNIFNRYLFCVLGIFTLFTVVGCASNSGGVWGISKQDFQTYKSTSLRNNITNVYLYIDGWTVVESVTELSTKAKKPVILLNGERLSDIDFHEMVHLRLEPGNYALSFADSNISGTTISVKKGDVDLVVVISIVNRRTDKSHNTITGESNIAPHMSGDHGYHGTTVGMRASSFDTKVINKSISPLDSVNIASVQKQFDIQKQQSRKDQGGIRKTETRIVKEEASRKSRERKQILNNFGNVLIAGAELVGKAAEEYAEQEVNSTPSKLAIPRNAVGDQPNDEENASQNQSSSSRVQESEGWWAVVSHATNPSGVGGKFFDCENTPIARLISVPFFMPSPRHELQDSKRSAKVQFLGYLYENRLMDLNKIAGNTMVSWGTIDVGKTAQEARDKAKRGGIYSPGRPCGMYNRNYEIIEIDFEYRSITGGSDEVGSKAFGSKTEFEAFKQYFNIKK